MKENKHVGTYGVCKKNNKILFIKKSRGPYKGLFDLPGGGIEFGENLKKALCREFQEEIGTEIKIKNLIGNTDHLSIWNNDGVKTKTHHIGLYYEVEILSENIKTDPDEHDSNGALWVSAEDIHRKNTSPIAYKILREYL